MKLFRNTFGYGVEVCHNASNIYRKRILAEVCCWSICFELKRRFSQLFQSERMNNNFWKFFEEVYPSFYCITRSAYWVRILSKLLSDYVMRNFYYLKKSLLSSTVRKFRSTKFNGVYGCFLFSGYTSTIDLSFSRMQAVWDDFGVINASMLMFSCAYHFILFVLPWRGLKVWGLFGHALLIFKFPCVKGVGNNYSNNFIAINLSEKQHTSFL